MRSFYNSPHFLSIFYTMVGTAFEKLSADIFNNSVCKLFSACIQQLCKDHVFLGSLLKFYSSQSLEFSMGFHYKHNKILIRIQEQQPNSKWINFHSRIISYIKGIMCSPFPHDCITYSSSITWILEIKQEGSICLFPTVLTVPWSPFTSLSNYILK